MSEHETRSGGGYQSMNEYQFTCSTCGQQIDVNETMREAIETNGCPVCTAAVDESEFSR